MPLANLITITGPKLLPAKLNTGCIKISFQRKAAYQCVILLSAQPGRSLPTLREYSNFAEIQVGNI